MNVSAFLAAWRFEWRILRRDAAAWAVLAAITAMSALAFFNGAERVAAQRAGIEDARRDEGRRIAALRASLANFEAGRVSGETPPYRDPRNAVFVGGGSGAAVAALEPAPLAIVASGQSDLLPAALAVTSGAKDSFLFAEEIENPAHLADGSIDLAFVLVFVFPLAILALCFDLTAAERERGTLALTLASAENPLLALLGKLAARAGLPIGAMIAATAAGVLLLCGPQTLVTGAFALLLGAIVAYGLFWALLAAVIDSFGKSSAHNALALVAVWAGVTMVAPAAVNTLADALYPAPSRSEMVLAARAAATDADRERDAALARYAEEHQGAAASPTTRGEAEERTLRRLAVQEAANARVEAVMAHHEEQLARQRALADRLSFLAPALLIYRSVADIAGSGDQRYLEFSRRVDEFHGRWREFFWSRARAGKPLTQEDYAALPRFSAETAVASAPAGVAARLGAGVGLPALLLAILALRGLRRCKAA
jgi:ABC-2 type transport system permease protein